MARIIQVLLPLVAAALTEAQLPHIPFFDNIPGLPGLHRPLRPISEGPRDSWMNHNNGHSGWFHHFGNPDEHLSSESNERDRSFETMDPYFYHGWDHRPGMPGINNVFNIPSPSHNSHRHQPLHKENNHQEKPKQDHKEEPKAVKPEEKPKELPPIDVKPQEKDPKLNEPKISDANDKMNEASTPEVENKLNEPKISDPINNEGLLPPKTNAIKKEDRADKGEKQEDLDKKKDYLLVGQGNNGNNVYLLHENNPNPTTVIAPNGNQPGNTIIYVPYNPGQSNNQVYQVVNGQPGQPNVEMTPDKLGVSNGYNNAVSNPGQLSMNNAVAQNPGYVTIYSNRQLIQVPGMVVNSAPNNVPVQNGNQGQGMNYIIANAVPNNMQTVPAVQNPGSNVIYATIPNQGSNGPIYVQVPNCINTMTNGCVSSAVVQNQGVNNGMTNNELPSNVIVYQANPNTAAQPVSNGYSQPNMVSNQDQGAMTVVIPNNQNVQYMPAVQMPINSVSNGYNHPIVSTLGQGQNVPNQQEKQKVPYQPMMNNNQAMMNNNQLNQPMMNNNQLMMKNQPMMTTNQPMMNSNQPMMSNNQPMVTSNQPIPSNNQPMMTSNQPMPSNNQPMTNNNQPIMNNNQPTYQPAVQMPVNSGANWYNQPISSNQPPAQNQPIQGTTISNPNTPAQSGVVIPIPSGYDHPLITNPIVNVETRGDPPSNQNNAQPAAPIPGDSNNQAIVNNPTNTEVINHKSDISQPLATSTLVLDSNNLSAMGAQPAIMITNFKDKSGDKKDKKKSKDKKEKKEKKDNEKKKDKKPKDDDKAKGDDKAKDGEKSEDLKPFTNKK